MNEIRTVDTKEILCWFVVYLHHDLTKELFCHDLSL